MSAVDASRTRSEARLAQLRAALAGCTEARQRVALRVRLADTLAAQGDANGAAAELRRAAAEGTSFPGLRLASAALALRLSAPDADALLTAVGVTPKRTGPRRASRRSDKDGVARRHGRLPGHGREAESRGSSSAASSTTPAAAPVVAEDAAAAPASASSADPSSPPGAPAKAKAASPAAALADVVVSAVKDPLDQAQDALAAGKPLLARRLAEEAARLATNPDAIHRARLRQLVSDLAARGARKQSLLLARTLAEGPSAPDPSSRASASHVADLGRLVAEAEEAGENALAARWAGDDQGGPLAVGASAVQSKFRDASRVLPGRAAVFKTPTGATPAATAATAAATRNAAASDTPSGADAARALRSFERTLKTAQAAHSIDPRGARAASTQAFDRLIDTLAASSDPAALCVMAERALSVGGAAAAVSTGLAAIGAAPADAPATNTSASPAEERVALRTKLLAAAYTAERSPSRRRDLARRWAEGLRAAGAATEALDVLNRAIAELPPEVTDALRSLRVSLLAELGHKAELARALEGDAAVATGTARASALRVCADLLDELGEREHALELRLHGLREAPVENDGTSTVLSAQLFLALLNPARRQLEATGRLSRSLSLALDALTRVRGRADRLGLLRDVAALAEAAGGDRGRAARAWRDVLALDPDDGPAAESAERLLREDGDWKALAELLGWAAARNLEPAKRAAALWKLAELHRTELGSPSSALPLLREIIAGQPAPREGVPTYADEDWQLRDDALAMHTARVLAAPSDDARAHALIDRAVALLDARASDDTPGANVKEDRRAVARERPATSRHAAMRLDEADRDLTRALDLDPAADGVLAALERLFEVRGDWRRLLQLLRARLPGPSPAAASRLWYGIGRASERLGDTVGARAAYEKAAADPAVGFAAPIAGLRRMAAARQDWTAAVSLLEREIALCARPLDRIALLIEMGGLVSNKLGQHARAIEILDAALALQPTNATALDAMYGAATAAGGWEKAAQALEALLASGTAVADAAERYLALGRIAETAGQPERALALYSRSYARDPSLRGTLERLSEICFERGLWENAWKATEHLIDRHRARLDMAERAALALRSALADLHVAQRIAATQRIAAMLGGSALEGGIRDVAESWGSMRFEPRLLAGLDGDRRGRVLTRLAEVLSITEALPAHPARAPAREVLAAIAVVERRWTDAVGMLDALAGEVNLQPPRRCLFAMTAGDILLASGERAAAAARYRRARLLNPAEPLLTRESVVHTVRDDRTDPIQL